MTADNRPALSVIIPTLNESAILGILLQQLVQQQNISLEVIVSDGGSVDNTVAIAEQHQVALVYGDAGRGAQLNRGAATATADYLLFLHADSGFSCTQQLHSAYAELQAAEAQHCPAIVAGHFPLHFVDDQGQRQASYRYLEAKTLLNRKNTTNGDQGFMLTRKSFNALGGFNETLPFLEDQDFAETFRDKGHWITFRTPLQTSNRRFQQEGFTQRYTLMTLIMLARAIGLQSFIESSPGLYRQQQATKKLRLTPFILKLRQLAFQAGFLNGIANIYSCGNFARENSWQFFLLLDIKLQGRHPRTGLQADSFRLMQLHDRHLYPLFRLPLIKQTLNVLAGVILSSWMLAAVPLFERIRSR